MAEAPESEGSVSEEGLMVDAVKVKQLPSLKEIPEEITAEGAEAVFGQIPNVADPDRLTTAENIALARAMHYAAWRHNTAKTSAESDRWNTQHECLVNMLWRGNRRLAYAVANKIHGPVDDYEDLAADGFVAMRPAIVTFNPWMGNAFSTYIMTCLMRAVSRQQNHLRQDARRTGDFSDAENQVVDHRPGLAEIDFQDVMRILEQVQSGEYGDLGPLERTVLQDRIIPRMFDEKARTLQEIGDHFRISKERVRQIEVVVQSKLRHLLGLTMAE